MERGPDDAAARIGRARSGYREIGAIGRFAAGGEELGTDVVCRHRRLFWCAAGWIFLRLEARRLGLGANGGARSRGAAASAAGAEGGRTESVDFVCVTRGASSAAKCELRVLWLGLHLLIN